MQPTADFNPTKVARSLLRRSRQGALATLMAESHDPEELLASVKLKGIEYGPLRQLNDTLDFARKGLQPGV